MKIKLLKECYGINKNLAVCMGTDTTIKSQFPMKEGEPQYYEGPDALGFNKHLFIRITDGYEFDIKNYEYSDKEHRLVFSRNQNVTNNKICTDTIDITTFEINNIQPTEFCILDEP